MAVATKGAKLMRREGVRIKRKAQVTIPKRIMEALNLRPDDELDVYIDRGRIVLEPMIRIPKDQAWYWTEGWQKAEREADADESAGRYTEYANVDDLLADLENEAEGNGKVE